MLDSGTIDHRWANGPWKDGRTSIHGDKAEASPRGLQCSSVE